MPRQGERPMQASNKDEMKATGDTSSFTSHYDANGESTHFATIATKAKTKPAGHALICGMFGFIAIIVIGTVSSPKGEASILTVLMAAIFGVGIVWILQRFRLNDERVAAADNRFFASRYLVSTLYPKQAKVTPDAIDLFRIRNTMTDAVIVSRQYISSPSLGAALGHAGSAARNQVAKIEGAYLQHLADNSYVVEIMTGGKGVVLAGGLDEDTATGLMYAVERAVTHP